MTTTANGVARAWASFTKSGNRSTDPHPQLYMVNLFSLLAFLSLGLFGLLQITIEGDSALGHLEVAGSLALALNIFGLRFTQNVELARTLLLLTMMTFLLLMLISGGTQHTGIFWYFVFPVAAFFLTGKRQGTRWMLGITLATLCVTLLAVAGLAQIDYTLVEVRQLLISMGVLAIGIYAFQHIREQTEARLLREQQALNQAKNDFLALGSHQLRTPISAISWYTEMLLHNDAGKLSQEQKEYIEQVYNSNLRSAAIVDAIITVSDLQVGRLQLHLESCDIVALCREVVKKQKTLNAERTVRIKEEYSTLPKLKCDPSFMRIIMQNLVSNAIKYTDDKGLITIAVERSKELLAPDSRGSISLSVTDNGYGIPKAEQSRIFAKLFRASNIKEIDTDGSGLGLYIVKAVLEQVGGRISYVSEEGKGSSFTVLLPMEGMHQAKGGSHS